MSMRSEIVPLSKLRPLEYLQSPKIDVQLLAWAQRLKIYGQLFPLIVTEDYQVISGQTWLAAFALAGIDDVEVKIVKSKHDPRTLRLICKVNRYESDVDPISIAHELPKDPVLLACLPLSKKERQLLEDTIDNIEVEFKSAKNRDR